MFQNLLESKMPSERRRYTDEVTLKTLHTSTCKSDRSMRATLLLMTIKKSTIQSYVTEARRFIRWIDCHSLSWKTDANGRRTFTLPTSVAELQPLDKVYCDNSNYEEVFVSLGKVDLERFTKYIYAHAVDHPISFDKLRAAIRLGQMIHPFHTWATSELARSLEKGARNLAIASNTLRDGRKRGTLDDNMIKVLLRTATLVNETMAEAMRVQIVAALRISELLSLRA